MITLRAPAKINLFLQVIAKRPDGYHELVSVMSAVGLYDRITLTLQEKKISVACKHPAVPEDETNSAYQAAHLFFKTLPKMKTTFGLGVHMAIDKHIPVGAGLGGGSSDAATVLMGLNRHFEKPFSKNELMAMGHTIGADVPFFIFGQPALATGIGEKLKAVKKMAPMPLILLNPGFSVSTGQVYKNLNLRLTKCNGKLKDTLFSIEGFYRPQALCNDLETVTLNMFPEV